jgi:VWFA-related protein
MRTFMRLLFACVCIAAMAIASRAQTQPAPEQRAEQKVIINAGEVLLDVVARDKKGRIVNDLRASDIEIYEDGVAQQVNAFRLVRRGGTGDGSAVADSVASSPQAASDSKNPAKAVVNSSVTNGAGDDSRLSAVAIVFDRMTPGARASAREAALSYVGAKDDLVGVFLTDLSLEVLQPYTDNMQQVRKAIENAGASNPVLYASNNEETRKVREQLVALIQGRKSNSPTDPLGGEAQMLAAELEMKLWHLEREEEVQRDQQGNATMHGLLKIVASLQSLPGRKAVIIFSEGLIIPPLVYPSFRALINAANRNNVSIYTVDAAGLRIESKTLETRKEIESRSNLRLAREEVNEESKLPMMKGVERNEDLLRLNPDSGLGQLADQTGGSYITDTNDIKTRLQKVDEDLHSYYLMSYSPKNQNYDGSFRKVEVKVKKPGLVVQSRKGYFAINEVYATPVLSYEVPALALLGKGERPDTFSLSAAAFNFPETGRTGLAPVIVEAPTEAFSFEVDGARKFYKTDFSIVVLLKDQSGQVVKKLSNQYQLSGAFDQLEAARRGRILFYREAELAPGSYRLEVAAYDQPTGRASVRIGTLEVPETDEGKLRLSSIAILRAVEKAGAAEKTGKPFQVGDLFLYPNVGEAVDKDASKQLPFFFTIYLPPGKATQPKLLIELRQEGRALAQIPTRLNPPDAEGRIQYMSGASLESIQPGEYELKVTVEDGTTTLTRSEFFSVEK